MKIGLAFKLFILLWTGLFCSINFNINTSFIFLFIAFILLMISIVSNSSVLKTISLYFCWFFLSIVFGIIFLNEHSSNYFKCNPKQFITLKGKIITEPRSNKKIENFLFETQDIENFNKKNFTRSILQVSIFDYKGQNLTNNDIIRLKGRIKSLDTSKPFDQYLKLQGIKGKMIVTGNNAEFISHPVTSILSYFTKIGNCLINSIRNTSVDQESQNILTALLFGNKADISKELKQSLINLNVYHAISISGLHFSAIGAIVIGVLGFLGIPKPYHLYFSIPLMLIFLLIIQFPPAASRSFLMISLFWMAPTFGRKADMLNLLGISGLILLFFNPYYFRDPGFILSFYAMIVLIVPGQGIANIFNFYFDPWLEKYKMDISFYKKFKWWKKWIILPLVYSTVAWISLFPMTAYYFQIFSWLSLLSNFLVIYAIPFILGCSLIASVGGFFFDIIAESFTHCAAIVLKTLNWILTQLNDLPFSYSLISEFNEKDLFFWTLLLWVGYFYLMYITENNLKRLPQDHL